VSEGTSVIKLLLLLLLRLFVTRKIPQEGRKMRCPAVRKRSCLHTMYRINNNVFSCVLKVVRQSFVLSNIRFVFFRRCEWNRDKMPYI